MCHSKYEYHVSYVMNNNLHKNAELVFGQQDALSIDFLNKFKSVFIKIIVFITIAYTFYFFIFEEIGKQ